MRPYSTSTATIQKAGPVFQRFLFSSSPRLADVERAVEVAFRYRHYFRKDIIIDLLVYRRWKVFLVDWFGLRSRFF